jgi:homocysteine S-methyltransferase
MTKIIDGGLSTELTRIGATFDGPLWTGRALLDEPSLIETAHRNFVEAGADVIITSSYQLSRAGFVALGMRPADADAALRRSVEVARAATAGSSARVAASIGPWGAIRHDSSEYRGNYGLSEDELTEFHRERIRVLEEAEPDLLLAETIPDLVEVRALARVLRDVDRPVWVSFSSSDGHHLHSGATITAAIKAVQALPTLEAIGFNCVPPHVVADLVAHAHEVTDADVAVYSNKGGTWDPDTGAWSDDDPRAFEEWWDEWAELGIDWVGGCCGTDATDIARLRERVLSTRLG